MLGFAALFPPLSLPHTLPHRGPVSLQVWSLYPADRSDRSPCRGLTSCSFNNLQEMRIMSTHPLPTMSLWGLSSGVGGHPGTGCGCPAVPGAVTRGSGTRVWLCVPKPPGPKPVDSAWPSLWASAAEGVCPDSGSQTASCLGPGTPRVHPPGLCPRCRVQNTCCSVCV